MIAAPFSGKKSAKKSQRRLTPPRPPASAAAAKSPAPRRRKMESGSGAVLTMAAAGMDEDDRRVEEALRTSELDPSDFQVDLPPLGHVLTSARICSVVNDYIEIGGVDFTFESLMAARAHFGDESHPIRKRLHEAGDDVVVQGFFREYSGGKGGGERVEACVFGSQKLRQFVVAFRGSTSTQGRPVRGGMQTMLCEEPTALLHPQQHPVSVVAAFRDAYFARDLEADVFALLEQLSALHPFYDVVMTGHSFGGALATIAAVRYASLHPMIRVSCHAFGCPRVGGASFRQLAHSLPNLKVIRIENGADPYVSLPEGSGWEHAGHAVAVDVAPSPTGTAAVAAVADGGQLQARQDSEQRSAAAVDVRAYCFDRDRPPSSANLFVSGVNAISRMATGQWLGGADSDHDIQAYVGKLERVPGLPEKFVGMEGDGVRGLDDEVRRVV